MQMVRVNLTHGKNSQIALTQHNKPFERAERV